MDFEDLKNKRIIIFCGDLSSVGGGERVDSGGVVEQYG